MDQKLELERFKTDIDLRVYAMAHRYELDRKESWAGSAVMRHANNDKIVIKRDADGHYVYFSVRDETDNGSIIDFAMKRLGLSLGEVRKALREFDGKAQPVLAAYPALQCIAKDRIRVERAYARMQVAPGHTYLEKERCIPRRVLVSWRFIGRIRVDARGNAVFPHYDAEGLTGFEIKNKGFTGFSTGGTKALWTSHFQRTDNRLVFCESAIDALSFAVLFPHAYTRFASLGGKPTSAQKELIRAAASIAPPSTLIVAAMDADDAGQELVETVREAVALAGRRDLRFEAARPNGVKDWNDALRAGRARATGRTQANGAQPI